MGLLRCTIAVSHDFNLKVDFLSQSFLVLTVLYILVLPAFYWLDWLALDFAPGSPGMDLNAELQSKIFSYSVTYSLFYM